MRTFIAACCSACFRSRCYVLKVSQTQASYIAHDDQLRGLDRGTEVHVCIDLPVKRPLAFAGIRQMIIERQYKIIEYGQI